MRLARSGGRWNARDELNVDRVELSGLWARRISRCVSPTWPTSYAHPRCLSFSSRPPFLSHSFAASNYTLGRVIFDPSKSCTQQTYPLYDRVTIQAMPNSVKIYPITDNDVSQGSIANSIFESSTVRFTSIEFLWNYIISIYDKYAMLLSRNAIEMSSRGWNERG